MLSNPKIAGYVSIEVKYEVERLIQCASFIWSCCHEKSKE